LQRAHSTRLRGIEKNKAAEQVSTAFSCSKFAIKIVSESVQKPHFFGILFKRKKAEKEPQTTDFSMICGFFAPICSAFGWSERRDSNPGPLGPEPSAIPNFATPRKMLAATLYENRKHSNYSD
jgi:hypothetical protein